MSEFESGFREFPKTLFGCVPKLNASKTKRQVYKLQKLCFCGFWHQSTLFVRFPDSPAACAMRSFTPLHILHKKMSRSHLAMETIQVMPNHVRLCIEERWFEGQGICLDGIVEVHPGRKTFCPVWLVQYIINHHSTSIISVQVSVSVTVVLPCGRQTLL